MYGPKGPLKPNLNSRGYFNVSLVNRDTAGTRQVKAFAVHSIIAGLFVHRPIEATEVNHKDGDKKNSAASNLEWVTSSANKLHATAHGLYPVGSKHHNYVDGSSDRGRVARRATIKQAYLQ